MRSEQPHPPLRIAGWQEWVALPALGLPAIKAKIDTGAKSSALHAETIDIVSRGGRETVRFTVRPSTRRADIMVTCEAPLAGRRQITSSNGSREERPVIRSRIVCGSVEAVIDISLTNRGGMSYRMLIGRQALTALGLLVDPALSFQMPKLGFKLYPGAKRKKPRERT